MHVYIHIYAYIHFYIYNILTERQVQRDVKAVPMPPQYVNEEKNFRSKKMNLGHKDKIYR